MILGLLFTKDTPRVDLPDMPRGLDPGLTLRVAVRRSGSDGRQRILELGTAAGSRVVLETGDSPDTLILAQEQGGIRRELVARGVLPPERWVHICTTLEPDGDARIEVFGLAVARGNIGNPDGAGRTENFLGRGRAGNPFVGALSQLHIWRSPSPDYLSDGSPALDSDKLWAAYALDRTPKISETQDGVTTTYYHLVDAGKLRKHGRSSIELGGMRSDEPLYDSQVRALKLVDGETQIQLAPLSALREGLTMEAWICPSDGTQLRSVVRLVGSTPLALCAGGPDGALSLVGYAKVSVGFLDVIDKQVPLLTAKSVLKAGVFSHIAATVQRISDQQYTATLYVQGQQVARASWKGIQSDANILALNGVLRADLLRSAIGGTSGLLPYKGFLGSIAELRLWSRALSASELGARWLTRAAGDEPGLAACYRLDELSSGCTRDISAVRGVATVPSGAILGVAGGLPLLPSSSSERVRIEARGKLVQERLLIRVPDPEIVTITMPQTNPLDLPSLPGSGNTGLPKAPKYQHENTLVFDATLKALSPSGESLRGATLEVRLDEGLRAISTVKDDTTFTAWQGGQTYRITVPASGTLRLRFIAGRLACPTLRVRIADQQADLWTIVRPDEKTHRQLRTLTAADLRSPVDGRSSPLPAGSTEDDAKALAAMCNSVGRVLPPFASAAAPQQTPLAAALKNAQFKSILGDVVNGLEQGVDAVGDCVNDTTHDVIDGVSGGIGALSAVGTSLYDSAGNLVGTVTDGVIAVSQDGARLARRLPKTASQLLNKSGSELDTLISNARRTGAQLGTSAISTFVRSADSLALATQSAVDDVVHTFELVGSTLVNGAVGYFRVVVRGINEALDALEAICERIGAAIEEVLAYLAYLFSWGDFLAASDEAQRFLEAQLTELPTFLQSLGEYKSKLGEYLNRAVDTSFLSKSLAQLCGIRVDPQNPVIEELDYVIEQVQRVQDYVSSQITSAMTNLGGTLAGSTQDQGLLTSQVTSCERLLPCGLLRNPTAAITSPINDLLKNAAGLSGSSGSILDALFDSLLSNIQQTIDKGCETMRKRINMGAVSDFIEKVILGGRDLTALRIVALCAAIPKVLSDKISASARSGSLSQRSLTRISLVTSSTTRGSTTTTDSTTTSQPKASPWEIWLPWSLSLVASVFLLVDTVREIAEAESPAKQAGGTFFQFLCGFFSIMKGLFQLRLVKLLPAGAQPYAQAGCALEATSGVWMMLSPVLRNSRSFANSQSFLNKLDVVIYGLLGLGQLVTLIVPLADGSLTSKDAITATCLRSAAYLSNMATRGLSAADNGDTTGGRQKVTLAFIAVSAALDLSDASYGQAIDSRR